MQIICQNCGKEAKHTGRGLCRACYRDIDTRMKFLGNHFVATVDAVCPECGNKFTRNKKNQQYCCRVCLTKAAHRRANERERAKRAENPTYLRADKAWLEAARKAAELELHDPFTAGRFVDGLPGLHAQVTPMEGMFSQPEHKEIV